MAAPVRKATRRRKAESAIGLGKKDRAVGAMQQVGGPGDQRLQQLRQIDQAADVLREGPQGLVRIDLSR